MIAWLLMVCAGCRPDSDYTLAIEPFTPPNVELAPDDPDVTLVHRVGMESTLLPRGPLADGGVAELPPLEDGVLGLLVTPTGTAGTEYVPSDLVAYGEAPLGGVLGADGEERTLAILVTEFAGSGDLGSIGRRRAPLLGGAAAFRSSRDPRTPRTP